MCCSKCRGCHSFMPIACVCVSSLRECARVNTSATCATGGTCCRLFVCVLSAVAQRETAVDRLQPLRHATAPVFGHSASCLEARPFRVASCWQFEDFNSNDAFPLLDTFRSKFLTYNDDIQVGLKPLAVRRQDCSTVGCRHFAGRRMRRFDSALLGAMWPGSAQVPDGRARRL